MAGIAECDLWTCSLEFILGESLGLDLDALDLKGILQVRPQLISQLGACTSGFCIHLLPILCL